MAQLVPFIQATSAARSNRTWKSDWKDEADFIFISATLQQVSLIYIQSHSTNTNRLCSRTVINKRFLRSHENRVSRYSPRTGLDTRCRTNEEADAGYDSESNHQYGREELGIRTVVPPHHGRPTWKPARGRYWRLLQTRFDQQASVQRWQVETVMSMIKRRQSDSTSRWSYLQSTQRYDVDGHYTQRHVTLRTI